MSHPRDNGLSSPSRVQSDVQLLVSAGMMLAGAALVVDNRENLTPKNAAGWAGFGLLVVGGYLNARAGIERSVSKVSSAYAQAIGGAFGGSSTPPGHLSGTSPPVLKIGGG